MQYFNESQDEEKQKAGKFVRAKKNILLANRFIRHRK